MGQSDRLLTESASPIPAWIPFNVAGTEDKGAALLLWCDQHEIKTVVVICTKDHSRRMSRVIRRGVAGYKKRAIIRSSRYSGFDPDDWWRSRAGVRTGIGELEKLLFDVGRHPLG